MKTLGYVLASEEEIKIGGKYYFGQLWDGNGDGKELLESGAIAPYNDEVVAFKIVDGDEDILQNLVEVTDIY